MYLLDTNVVSELRKARLADSNVLQWATRVNPRDLYLSVITVEELEIGVLLIERRDARQSFVMRAWMEQVLATFAGRVLPVDQAVARRAAQLHVPDPRPIRDGLIAATALVRGFAMVTRNIADFEPMGVTTLNPWRT